MKSEKFDQAFEQISDDLLQDALDVYKRNDIKRKLLLIIPVVFLLLLIGLVVYWNPPTTAVSLKFDAVKIDEDCNELGNFTIELSGEKIEPYFEDPRLDLTMVPFDGLQSLTMDSDSSIFDGSRIKTHMSGAFQEISCDSFDPVKNDFRGARIAFSPDFDRWAYYDYQSETCYVGSVSGNYTVQELYEYFKPLITGRWSPTDG